MILIKRPHFITESQKPFILSSFRTPALNPLLQWFVGFFFICLYNIFYSQFNLGATWDSLKPGKILKKPKIWSWPWKLSCLQLFCVMSITDRSATVTLVNIAGLLSDVPAVPRGAGCDGMELTIIPVSCSLLTYIWSKPSTNTALNKQNTCTSLCRCEGASVEPHPMGADAQNKQPSLS